jgi:UDP-N-acetylmuramyl tripeptide synthase
MEAALVSVSTGVMEPLIAKLTKLLGDEYVKLKGIRKQVRFLRDELSAMSAALQMLGDAQELNPVMKDWRDKLRELAYDIEDCIDDFMARVDLDKDAVNGFNFKGLFLKFKKLIEFHEIANEIEQLKARAIEASERHKRYDFTEHSSTNSSTSAIAIDPRLPALYEEIGNLVGIESPKERIIEWLTTTVLTNNGSSSARLKVISIAGCGGLGKTTLANQVYHTIPSQFMCGVFVTVSRSPNMRKVLRDIAQGVGIPEKTSKNDDEQQLIEKLREHLQDKRYTLRSSVYKSQYIHVPNL